MRRAGDLAAPFGLDPLDGRRRGARASGPNDLRVLETRRGMWRSERKTQLQTFVAPYDSFNGAGEMPAAVGLGIRERAGTSQRDWAFGKRGLGHANSNETARHGCVYLCCNQRPRDTIVP